MTIYFSTTSTESSNENKKNVEKGALSVNFLHFEF